MKFLVVLSALFCACVALPTSLDTNRIVGGYDAEDGSAPYMVSLQDKNKRHFCGGSIQNKRWILTAAHCVDSGELSMQVYVGSNSLSKGGEHYAVEKIVVHELYNKDGAFGNDIALVKVNKDIKFGEKVQPIVPHREFVKGGEDLKITGWGLTNQTVNVVPDWLQELKVKAVSNDDCAIRSSVRPTTQICGFKALNHGACMGDSGGPLTLNEEQVGIASFVLGGCAKGYPDFYTRVSQFVDWIGNNAI